MIKEFKFGGQTVYNVTAQQLSDMGFFQSDIDAALKAQDITDVDFNRRLAYLTDSDPLYMEWQYDKTDTKEKEWRAKVAEIKVRYPLPGE